MSDVPPRCEAGIEIGPWVGQCVWPKGHRYAHVARCEEAVANTSAGQEYDAGGLFEWPLADIDPDSPRARAKELPA